MKHLMTALTLSLVLLAATLRADDETITCSGDYPYHLQGVCTDGTNIYWTFTTVLVKTDRTGKALKTFQIEREEGHLGDLCWKDGLVYIGVNRARNEKDDVRNGDEVWAFDPVTLACVKKFPTPQTVWDNNGIEWHDGSFWIIEGAPKYCRYNSLLQYDEQFRFRRRILADTGWTNLGVQTIVLANGKLLLGCYGARDDKQEPHMDCAAVIDAAELVGNWTKRPSKKQIIPCEKRIPGYFAEGLLVLDGKVWRAGGFRTQTDPIRWSARLAPEGDLTRAVGL